MSRRISVCVNEMKTKNYEIRIHGRAGQGAKSAADFLAAVAAKQGKFVQAFPQYGPERMGA
ncbi:MAG: Pyruvate ferredoxin oxidoreductase, gamma subunit, partial [uncultured bacterium]